jgi:peptidyl-prolyl cis-trans isomerase D
MLQKLRQYSKSWISNVFLGLLSLAFVSWGVGDILQGRTDTSVVKVGSTAVDQSEFQRDYNNYLRNLGAQQGVTITPEMAKRAHIGDQLLQQTVLFTALDNVAKRLGLTAADATVTTRIRSMQQFAGLNGAFDRATFEQAISRYNYTEKSFLELIRSDFIRAQLENAVEGGFVLPSGYARMLLAYTTEMRAADYVVVSDASLKPIAPPPDAVLQAYIKAHASGYSTPEYRDVTFAKLAPEDVKGTLTASEAQIRQAYDNRKSRYVVDEKRAVERLTFPSQKEAEAAHAKIAAGQSFENAAKARGFSQKDIDLGEIVAKDLDPSEAKSVFALKQGGVSEAVKSTFGWNIYHVSRIVAGSTKTIDQVREELTGLVLDELARAKLDDASNAYTDAMTAGLSLAEAAAKAGMKISHATAVDRDGLTPDGTKAAAPDDAEFRELVFKAEVGEEGDPVLSKAGALYVLQVNGVVPPKLRPLAQVREKALAAWTAEQRTIQLKARAVALTAQATREKSLDGVAKAVGATVQHSKVLTRRAGAGPFSDTLLEAFFDAAPGAAVFGQPAGNGQGYVVARVTAVAHRLPPEKSPEFARAVSVFSRSVGSDVTTSFAYAARDRQGVKINQKMLDSVIGKGEGL